MAWVSYHTREIKEKYLFKFLSMGYLIDFLKTGCIWFSRADQFGDKMECVRIQDLITKPIYEEIEYRKRKFLISCWHIANKESLALWDTYSDTVEKRRTVAIRFNRELLVQHIKNRIFKNDTFYYRTKWVHGKVLYKDLINARLELLKNSTVKYPAFRKEGAFKYENEYRFVVQLIAPSEEIGFPYYLGEAPLLSFDILINPLLKKEEYNGLKTEITKMGFGDKLVPSDLTKWLQPELW